MDLGELVSLHQASLFAFLFRMSGDRTVAEDLMQETFVRALRASATYRPEGKVSAWLFSIAANLCKDYWRRQAKRECAPLCDDSLERASGGAPSPEDRLMQKTDALLVRRALLQLPVEQRSPLVLFYYHDMSYKEIAECLVLPVGTVRSRIHCGKERLKSLLEGAVVHD